MALAAQPEPADSGALARYGTFEDVVALIRARRDGKLLIDVEAHVRLARYAPGRIEFTPTDDAPADLAARLAQRLQAWTGVRWGVSVVPDAEAETIAEVRAARRDDLVGQAMAHPLVQAVVAAFPGVTDAHVRVADAQAAEAEAPPAEPDEDDDTWDPFDEDG